MHSRCICGLPTRSCMVAMLLKMLEGRRDNMEKKHVGFLYCSCKESDSRVQICDSRHQKDEANMASERVGAHPSTGKRAAVRLKYSTLCR
jgi:hypothetical protein